MKAPISAGTVKFVNKSTSKVIVHCLTIIHRMPPLLPSNCRFLLSNGQVFVLYHTIQKF